MLKRRCRCWSSPLPYVSHWAPSFPHPHKSFLFPFPHFSLLSEVLCWPGFLVFGRPCAILSSALVKVIHFIIIGRGGRNNSDIVRPVRDTWHQSAGYWCSPMSTLTPSLCSKMSMPCQSSAFVSCSLTKSWHGVSLRVNIHGLVSGLMHLLAPILLFKLFSWGVYSLRLYFSQGCS